MVSLCSTHQCASNDMHVDLEVIYTRAGLLLGAERAGPGVVV